MAAVAVAVLWQLVPLWLLEVNQDLQISHAYHRLFLVAVALRLPHCQRQLVPLQFLEEAVAVAVALRMPHWQRQLLALEHLEEAEEEPKSMIRCEAKRASRVTQRASKKAPQRRSIIGDR